MIVASLALLGATAGWKIASFPHVASRIAVHASPPPAYAAPAAAPDAVQLDHLFLTVQHEASIPACHTMADQLGFAVPCPNLLPTDAFISGPACCIFGNPKVAPLFVLESHFTAPAGYPPAEASSGPATGHLVIIAERRTPIASALSCQTTISDGTGPPIWGSTSYWELCHVPGTNQGHRILEWETAGIAYSVSLHGETEENRTAIALIAVHLDLVEPGVGGADG